MVAGYDFEQDTVDEMLDFYADNTDSEIKLKNCDLSKLIINVIGGNKFITSNESTPKYVICIDEINRGNLSRIFGELITCVEENKRHGAAEPIEVTLPGSGDKFIVPDNLYIIGTMNTADRSLVKFDNAMRRRFDFEYIGPDSALVPEPYRESFKALNRNIRIKLTKDFEIGHAYFMGIKDDKQFEAVVRKKIIPLLEEYFFDNPEAIYEITAGTMFENFLRVDN